MNVTELIAIPIKANLDVLGAARCLMLANPQARLIYPLKLLSNASNYLKSANWLSTIKFSEIDWKKVKKVYLIDIIYQKHNPELINQISACNIETICYSHRCSRLPFHPVENKIDTFSITAWLFSKLLGLDFQLSSKDAELLAIAVNEKTWAGLDSRVTDIDLTTLSILDNHKVSSESIANSIVLGMREGQIKLHKVMLQNVEYLRRNSNLIAFVAVANVDKIEELKVIVDTLWSDLAVATLVVLVSEGESARVWARSSLIQVDYYEMFKQFRPIRRSRWVTFKLAKSNLLVQRSYLISFMAANTKPQLLASDIMAVSPICIEHSETVSFALDMMLKFNIMSLIVTSDKEFDGIITRRDIDRAMHMEHPDAEVATFSQKHIPSIKPDVPVHMLRSMMIRQNLPKLPVVDNGKVVGLITSGELLRVIAEDLSDFNLLDEAELPKPFELLKLVKQFFPIKILHLLTKIGNYAQEQGLKAYAVGGFVRDLLLEKKNLDIDIVVLGDAIQFAKDISEKFDCDYKVFDRFHTSRIYIDDMKIDFSSARIEHYSSPGALPKIAFSGLSNDLNRRDFSVNALALSLLPDNFLELKDFFGGYTDLKQKSLRILHQFSFIEDPTRLFRAIRFISRFNFSMEKDTRRAFELAIQKDAVSVLSLKRISSEITRCFNEERPHKSIKQLFEVGLLKYLDVELTDISVLPTRFRLIAGLVRRFRILKEDIDIEAIYWTGLLSVLPVKRVENLFDAIGGAHVSKRLVVQAITASEDMQEQLSKVNITNRLGLYKLLHELNIETYISLIVFSLNKQNAKKVLHFIGTIRGIKCQISGKDLLAAGIPEGPHIREYFQAILSQKLNGENFSKEEELNYAIKLHKRL